MLTHVDVCRLRTRAGDVGTSTLLLPLLMHPEIAVRRQALLALANVCTTKTKKYVPVKKKTEIAVRLQALLALANVCTGKNKKA